MSPFAKVPLHIDKGEHFHGRCFGQWPDQLSILRTWSLHHCHPLTWRGESTDLCGSGQQLYKEEHQAELETGKLEDARLPKGKELFLPYQHTLCSKKMHQENSYCKSVEQGQEKEWMILTALSASWAVGRYSIAVACRTAELKQMRQKMLFVFLCQEWWFLYSYVRPIILQIILEDMRILWYFT